MIYGGIYKKPTLPFLWFVCVHIYNKPIKGMKPVLIVENSSNSLSVNENTKGQDGYLLGGIFTEFGVKNRNDRVYMADRFLPALQELNERIATLGVVYGEFDHPDVFDTSLSRSSHLVKSATYVKEHSRVEGEIKLLSTYWGREAKALVNDGCPIFVSSRAAGVTESDGSVTLKKLFTYDIVADPGFGSAKMHVKSLNESLGYSDNANFRIYEMSDDSKINDLFNMNKNDFATKRDITDYSQYLIGELSKTRKMVNEALTKGNVEPSKLEKMLEYYEELQHTNQKMVGYLDYLAEKLQIVVNENKSLKQKTDKIIEHNDYLAEQLEKAIEYSEYIAEKLDQNIGYSEYLAENLDKTISYSEYIAENLDKNIAYSEYIAENLDKNIAYSEYIAENLDKNIAYSEYLAENLDKSIAYGEYLAEHIEGNIAYTEYIAENLDDTIAYGEYVAEKLDQSISYQGMIVEKLNSTKINESVDGEMAFPSLEDAGFETLEDEQEVIFGDEGDNTTFDETPGQEDVCVPCGGGMSDDMSDDMTGVADEFEEELTDDEPIVMEKITGDSDTELSKKIDELIQKEKLRKVNETTEVHFLKFLNRSQVDSFYNLTEDEQENVKLYISERSFFTTQDVLKLIGEALSTKSETLEERVLRLMPDNIKPIWNQMNENARKSILSQARLYPEEMLMTESQVESFWGTRNLKKNEPVTKKLVGHEALIQEDKLSDKEMNAILERLKTL
jgi:hypothetical protein